MRTKPKAIVKGSAMRFSLTIISISVALAIIGIMVHVVIQTFKGETVEWSGIGIFVGGLAALLTGSGWNKTKQKEIEVNEKE
jgi:protein-S-isoprenylcysteine O-methyltransferase Ste14